MKNKQIAVLLTCFNRKDKTIRCLHSFFSANKPSGYIFDVFLVDDGSIDGTGDEVKMNFPYVYVIEGNGDLFWAGGMRLAWETAIEKDKYHAYLLLNDDVILDVNFIYNLIETEGFALKENGETGIYSASTIDPITKKTTYGALKIKTNHVVVRSQLLHPSEEPQKCELTNANILWISKETVNTIGVFDKRYTHGLADYDYSLQAIKNGIPVYLAPHIGGLCIHDHGRSEERRVGKRV